MAEPDPEEQSVDVILHSFLSEWRHELQRPREADGGHLLGKRGRADDPGVAASKKKPVPFREPSPLLVLPAPRGSSAAAQVHNTVTGEQQISSGSTTGAVGAHLVDRLIADLVSTTSEFCTALMNFPARNTSERKRILTAVLNCIVYCNLCTSDVLASLVHSKEAQNKETSKLCL